MMTSLNPLKVLKCKEYVILLLLIYILICPPPIESKFNFTKEKLKMEFLKQLEFEQF